MNSRRRLDRTFFILIFSFVLIASFAGCGGGSGAAPFQSSTANATADPPSTGSASTPSVVSIMPSDTTTGVSISQIVKVTFSEPMDASTLSAGALNLTGPGGVVVAGSVSASGSSAIFTPASQLAPNAFYKVTIATAAKSTAGAALAAAATANFRTGSSFGNTPPTVSYTFPPDGSGAAPLNAQILVAFSEAMDPTSINADSVKVTAPGGASVSGAVTYTPAGDVVTFQPASALQANITYTATITTGVTSLAGHSLASPFSWTFVGTNPNSTGPTVISTNPLNRTTGVPITQPIAVTFSEPMNPATINASTFVLTGAGGPTSSIPGLVVYVAGANTATFVPVIELGANTVYAASVTTGAQDLSGNPLASNYTFSFTTTATPFVPIPPAVVVTSPSNNSTGVATNQNVSATFSDFMDPASITTADFTLTGPNGSSVTGTVAYDTDAKFATFAPLGGLSPNTTYTASLTTGIANWLDDSLAQNYVWSFTTGSAASAQSPVDLGASAAFAVLAHTVSSTGATVVNGDLGASSSSAVTGFPPGLVNGAIHAGNSAYQQAEASLILAYNDAASRAAGSVSLGYELGGLTLAPGLYQSSSALQIAAGDLTLDAQGNSNAVFIFTTPQSLVEIVSTHVILINGAKASNVFWQVGSFVTLAQSSVFQGNILAAGSIAVQNGAAVTGRVMSANADVTLDTNTITLPSP